MTPLTIGIIGVAVLFVLLFFRMPIGLALGFVGFTGFAYLTSFDAGLGMIKPVAYSTFASQALSVVPLFVLMGTFALHAGLSKDLYETVYKWLGHLPGGLAMATIAACAAFGAVTGSSIASAATMAMVALPEMRRYNYIDSLATGSVAAGGLLALLIPPSLSFIVYGLITGTSIGKLFIAGFIPGIILSLFFMATILILCQRNPLIGPRGPKTSFKEKVVSLKGTWMVIVLFVVIIGGIYVGVFTPTEAAGVGAFGAFILAFTRRQLSWRALKSSLIDTGSTTGMIFLIILGAMIFSYFLAVSRLPFELASAISGLAVNRYIIIGIICVVMMALGCVMESLSLILLTVPIFYPGVMALGFDPIWFGVLVTVMIEIGLITPPVGLNVYVIQGIAKNIPMYTIFRGIVPFLIASLVFTVLIIAFPQITLILPELMK